MFLLHDSNRSQFVAAHCAGFMVDNLIVGGCTRLRLEEGGGSDVGVFLLHVSNRSQKVAAHCAGFVVGGCAHGEAGGGGSCEVVVPQSNLGCFCDSSAWYGENLSDQNESFSEPFRSRKKPSRSIRSNF